MNEKFYYNFSLLPSCIEKLLAKLRIAVVCGGDSQKEGSVIHRTHNPRPWKSYEQVARDIQAALQGIGFKHVYLFADDMKLIGNLEKEHIHLVWLNTGGVQGYNPLAHTVSFLEMLGIPYIGHDPLNASILDNKHIFKYALQSLGIRTAPFIVWDSSSGSLQPRSNPIFLDNFGNYAGPFIAKPVSGRASKQVRLVHSLRELPSVVAEIYAATHNHVLIEKYLPGAEYCAAVYGFVSCKGGKLSKREEPFVFSEIERVFEEDEQVFTSMDVKAITGERFRTLDNENQGVLKKELQKLTKQIYLSFNLKSLIRLDIRADVDGQLNVLEVNPKPDLKKPSSVITSLTCSGLLEHGMDYNDLVLGIFADRLDYLLTHHRETYKFIAELL